MGNRLIENVIRVLNCAFPEFQPERSHGDPFRVQNDFKTSSKFPEVARSSPGVALERKKKQQKLCHTII